jgi:predicted metal-dependent TIM-barrel fold hydrolase
MNDDFDPKTLFIDQIFAILDDEIRSVVHSCLPPGSKVCAQGNSTLWIKRSAMPPDDEMIEHAGSAILNCMLHTDLYVGQFAGSQFQ